MSADNPLLAGATWLFEPLLQLFNACHRHFIQIHCIRCQFRRGHLRQNIIIEADDGNIFRNPVTSCLQGLHQIIGGHVAIAGECSWHVVQLLQ